MDMSLEAKMLENIVKGLQHHDASCPMPAQAVLISHFDRERFDWEDINGVPVVAADDIQPERFRIQCDGSANGIEDALEEFIEAPEQIPLEEPAEDRPLVPLAPVTPERSPFTAD
jgi:hypothetical protein